ncbi:unnamed protein product [Phytophthora fragariaefolia]|uniref:Unnamed protein product n=1 Tax=Phytophthora fragariaefolia TaxID=1490495 RepID=A0A9W7CVV9_9STRA|nr:unnamed protein product [Phytophthora fragariaefolia]
MPSRSRSIWCNHLVNPERARSGRSGTSARRRAGMAPQQGIPPLLGVVNWVFLGHLSGSLFPGGNVYWPPDDPRTAKTPKDHHPRPLDCLARDIDQPRSPRRPRQEEAASDTERQGTNTPKDIPSGRFCLRLDHDPPTAD